ncbi:MAG: PQQ-binding-like beta-propeller repeat protein [Hansschlegelia sp.]
MTLRTLALVAMLAIGQAAASPAYAFEPEDDVSDAKPAKTSEWTHQAYGPGRTAFNEAEKTLTLKNISGLKQKWAFESNGGTAPTAADGLIFLGEGSAVYARKQSNGYSAWSREMNNTVRVPPAVVDGVVYVAPSGPIVYALNAKTGKVKWKAKGAGAQGFGNASPLVTNGRVYVGANDGKLYAFDAADGSKLWSAKTTGAAIISPPAYGNGLVFVASDTSVYAFDAEKGKLAWTYKMSDGGPAFAVAVSKARVYVPAGRSLVALGAKTGELLFSVKAIGADASIATAPAVTSKYVVFRDGNTIRAVKAKTGAGVWNTYATRLSSVTPSIANGVVYADNYSALAAYDLETGSYVKGVTVGPMTSPTVADGTVFVSGGTGYGLAAFSVP